MAIGHARAQRRKAKDILYACRAHFAVDVCGDRVYLSMLTDILRCRMLVGPVGSRTSQRDVYVYNQERSWLVL